MGDGGIVDTVLQGQDGDDGDSASRSGAADPIAIAVAMDGARFDPALSAKAGLYLDEQRRLTKIQTEDLLEQGAFHVSHLKLRRWSERMRLGLQLLLALAGLVVVFAAAVMLHDAFSSRSVVVSAFETPPSLAGRGLNGTVVASQILDGLQKLQDATRGPSQGLKTRGAWTSDIKIEVPETGISIGEIDRLLHERFGHDVHIAGDLIQTAAGGLALTIRGDDIPARTFGGGIDDLDKLATQASEYVYGRSQPWQYSIYLFNANRYQEVFDFVAGAFPRAPEAERPNLANAWGVALMSAGRYAESNDKFRLVMTLSVPRSDTWWKGWANLINGLFSTRQEEAAWSEGRTFLAEADKASPSEKPALRLIQTPANEMSDYPLLLRALEADAAHNGGVGANSLADGPAIADVYGLMHDPANAVRFMAISDPDDPARKIETNLLQAYAAFERSDFAGATRAMEAYDKAWLADINLQSIQLDGPCYLGLAYGMSGRMKEAEALFTRMGPWSRCIAYRGDVLAHAGDPAGAMRVWADGISKTPDMTLLYLHRGLFELSTGHLRAAQADFATASAKAPHFADPLKAWGDVLARAGHWPAALAKYDEAMRYAPAWTALRQARAVAAKRVTA